MKSLTASECAAWLAGHDDYLIVSHRRPDGDTLCSGAALCSALRRRGKSAWCLRNAELTETYRPYMEPYMEEGSAPHAVTVTVDVASEGLIPEGVGAPIALAIDHHPSNSRFADNLCLAAESSSCGELVMDIIRELCGNLTSEEARLLYIAVSTDTGCFQYSNTNPHTLRAAAELIELGADNHEINTQFFRTFSHARLKLEGLMLSGMQYFREGKISATLVTREMLARCAAGESDCEDLAGIAGRAKGSLVSIMVREIGPGVSKVSVRTKPGYNASDICAVFCGGGHAMAAGATLNLPPEQALEKLLTAVYGLYPEL